jgi:integrase
MRAPRRLQRESPASPFIFVSERGSPFTTADFARMIERAAGAGLELKVHPHMLRHACGYAHPRHSGLAWASVDHQPSTRRWRRTGSRTSGGTRVEPA